MIVEINLTYLLIFVGIVIGIFVLSDFFGSGIL